MLIDSLSFDDYHGMQESGLRVAIEDDVLTGSGTRQYAKMESKNKVRLIGLSILNTGQRELNLPADLVFETYNGDYIMPFVLEEAMEALIDPVTDEENTSAIEIELSPGWKILRSMGKGINESKTVISHVLFVEDMSAHYMENWSLAPGESIKGYLVLPLRKGIPLKITLGSQL